VSDVIMHNERLLRVDLTHQQCRGGMVAIARGGRPEST
jgi:hypothetical protein